MVVMGVEETHGFRGIKVCGVGKQEEEEEEEEEEETRVVIVLVLLRGYDHCDCFA